MRKVWFPANPNWVNSPWHDCAQGFANQPCRGCGSYCGGKAWLRLTLNAKPLAPLGGKLNLGHEPRCSAVCQRLKPLRAEDQRQ
jgi:hypothetical protein